MEIQLTLQHIGMQLDDTKKTFYTERKELQPDPEMLGQLVEDFRDELDKLDSQVRSLRCGLQRMEDSLEVIELSEA
ncbi:MAG: hypothetical protein F4Y31_09600 [Gammaproteobacteria bacterium]|nr:hypothetical protein [Gammaproteobacteria bacterium]MYF67897.1 hypothetical protein [Gammaproteobacteria bacterium]MYK37820.1 hypothetical protein [Gammaproteobacteria bacterium]